MDADVCWTVSQTTSLPKGLVFCGTMKAAWTQELGLPWDGNTFATAGDLLTATEDSRFARCHSLAVSRT
jgi:hypothetical protein